MFNYKFNNKKKPLECSEFWLFVCSVYAMLEDVSAPYMKMHGMEPVESWSIWCGYKQLGKMIYSWILLNQSTTIETSISASPAFMK